MVVVIYEVSVLGAARRHVTTRTGIYHYIRNLARALKEIPEVTLLPVCGERRWLVPAIEECEALGLSSRILRRQRGVVAPLLERVAGFCQAMTSALSRRLHSGLALRLLRYGPARLAAVCAAASERRFEAATARLLRGLSQDHKGALLLHETYTCHDLLRPLRRLGQTWPRCVTLYDAIPLRFPHYCQPHISDQFGRFLAALRPDDQLIAISACTREDVLALLPFTPLRPVAVTHLSVDERFQPIPPSQWTGPARAILQRHGLRPGAFVLSIATIEPRKNAPALLQAFARVKAASDDPQLKLVLVGAAGWEQTDLGRLAEALGLQGSIVLTGYLDDDSLPSLLSAAAVFCYPSLYEGFGLPVLEAMRCGCPVVSSANSSLQEVFAGAALLVDPSQPEALAGAITRILSEPPLAAQLRRAGFDLASRLSWDQLAQGTLQAYRDALTMAPPL